MFALHLLLQEYNYRNEIFWTSGRLISPEDRIADPPGYYPGSTPTANLLDPSIDYSSSSTFVEEELTRRKNNGRFRNNNNNKNSSASSGFSAAEMNFVGEIRNWIWYSTGKPIRLKNWVAGNPRRDPNATCVELNTETYQWASFSCDAKFRFVCEVNYDA